MKMTGNTILVTGGGSGIGRRLAEELHKLGNEVVIAGRRQAVLDKVATANPGMKTAVFDVSNAADIERFGAELVAAYPTLNAVIHNAGIMQPESFSERPGDASIAEATIATNLLGPIRLTAALLPHLLKQEQATIMTVSSGLAFLPLTATPTYCATKAAIHSWTQSLRYQLRSTPVEVLELIPPYVATELMGAAQAQDPRAMPLEEFISEAIEILKAAPESGEICVKRVYPLRFVDKNGNFAEVFTALNTEPAH